MSEKLPYIPPCEDCLEGKVDGEFFTNMDRDEFQALLGGKIVKFPHSGYHRCGLKRSETQSISSEIWTDLNWDTEIYDVGSMHDSENPNRILINKDGYYGFVFLVQIEAEEEIVYQVRLMKNGSSSIVTIENTGVKEANYIAIPLSTFEISLSKGDYVSLQVYHNSLTAKSINQSNTFISAKRAR